MKHRLLRFFSQKHTYRIGNVKIKSNIPLTEGQVTEIGNIVTQVMKNCFFERRYQIARRVVHNLGTTVSFADCKYRGNFHPNWLTLSLKYENKRCINYIFYFFFK